MENYKKKGTGAEAGYLKRIMAELEKPTLMEEGETETAIKRDDLIKAGMADTEYEGTDYFQVEGGVDNAIIRVNRQALPFPDSVPDVHICARVLGLSLKNFVFLIILSFDESEYTYEIEDNEIFFTWKKTIGYYKLIELLNKRARLAMMN